MLLFLVSDFFTWPIWLTQLEWLIAFMLDRQGIPFPVALAVAKAIATGIWNSICG